jgi:hypothetical protein
MTLAKIGLCAGACALGMFMGCTEPTPASDGPTAPTSDGGDTSIEDAGGCDFGEPNDTLAEAKTIELNRVYSGLCVSNDDRTDEIDTFEVVTPSSPAGGVIEVVIDNVTSDGTADVIVSGIDGETIVEASTLEVNGAVSGWFAAAPSSKYHVRVTRTGGPGRRFGYDLRANFKAIDDPFEPNNGKEAAKTIEAKRPIHASAAAPSANAVLEPGEDHDWYTLRLGGDATIKVTGNPPDFTCDVELVDATGERVGENYSVTPGADCILEARDLQDGSYFINVHGFGGVERAKSNAPIAPYLVGQYTLEVVQ